MVAVREEIKRSGAKLREIAAAVGGSHATWGKFLAGAAPSEATLLAAERWLAEYKAKAPRPIAGAELETLEDELAKLRDQAEAVRRRIQEARQAAELAVRDPSLADFEDVSEPPKPQRKSKGD